MKNNLKGFTLIEILLAIGILAILATVAIIAINPARQFAQARNTQRWSDVNVIMNAISQYSIEHEGQLPQEIPLLGTGLIEVCVADALECSTVIGVPSLTDGAIYLTIFPVDPSCPSACTPYGTGYAFETNTDGRVHVVALNAELGETIELVR